MQFKCDSSFLIAVANVRVCLLLTSRDFWIAGVAWLLVSGMIFEKRCMFEAVHSILECDDESFNGFAFDFVCFTWI